MFMMFFITFLKKVIKPKKKNPKRSKTAGISAAKRDPSAAAEIRHLPPPPESFALPVSAAQAMPPATQTSLE
jgi:hypothetical protein